MSPARELALAGLALCLVAALLGVSALYIPGLAALFVALAAPLWVALAIARARVGLHVEADVVQEGERLRLAVEVRRGLVPFPTVTLIMGDGANALEPTLRARHSELSLHVEMRRRGRHTLGPVRLRVADPLGLCVRELRSGTHTLLVLPSVHPIAALRLRGLDERTRSPMTGALELDALRAHDPGASASRIHWPTVARTGVLMERSFSTEADQRVMVLLDAYRPDSEELLDQALRATASLCVHLARRGGCLLLLPDARRPALVGDDQHRWRALHARLALVRAAANPRPRLPPRVPNTILYVTARSDALPAARSEYYRVGPRPLAGLTTAFSVAGCAGQLVSERARAGVR